MNGWKSINTCPENVIVNTCILSEKVERMVQKLIRKNNLFFFPAEDMYVYYSPTHYKEV